MAHILLIPVKLFSLAINLIVVNDECLVRLCYWKLPTLAIICSIQKVFKISSSLNQKWPSSNVEYDQKSDLAMFGIIKKTQENPPASSYLPTTSIGLTLISSNLPVWISAEKYLPCLRCQSNLLIMWNMRCQVKRSIFWETFLLHEEYHPQSYL